jgi:hypothetical protein
MRTKLIGLIYIVLLMTGCAQPPTQQEMNQMDYGPYPSDYKGAVERYLRNVLKDPDSARVEYVRGPGKQYQKMGPLFGGGVTAGYGVCAWVNARNSYGGYTGAKLSWFMVKNGRVIQSAISTTRDSFETIQAEKGCETIGPSDEFANLPKESSDGQDKSSNKETKTKKLIELATDDDGRMCQSHSDCDAGYSCRSKKGGGSVCKKID